MNLKLYIFKHREALNYSNGRYIRFAVVDLDISKNYPANFVCLLLREIIVKDKAKSNFSKMLGEDSLKLAIRLLTKALKTERDSEVKEEIEKRLNMLKQKNSALAKNDFLQPT